MNTVTISFYRADDSRVGVLSNISLMDARINANAMLRSCDFIAKAVIVGEDVAEVMYPEVWLDPCFPLADIRSMPVIPNTPNARLARHFQMAGAVDQDVVWHLAWLMKSFVPNPVVRAKKGTINFLNRAAELDRPIPPGDGGMEDNVHQY